MTMRMGSGGPRGYRRRRQQGGRWLVAGGLAAAVLVIGGAFVLGGGGGSGGIFSEARTPAPTVEPVDLSALPAGEVVPADLAEPLEYGGFVILPAGSTAVACGVPVPAGRAFASYDIRESRDPEAYREHALWYQPLALPDGWVFEKAHAENVVWDDGSFTESVYWAEYARGGLSGAVRVTWSVIESGCEPELVNLGADYKRSLTLGTLGGREVVYLYTTPGAEAAQMLNVLFLRGNVLTLMETAGVPLGEVAALGTELAE
ncbi:MAG: hypothetical protein ACSLFM_13650 [Tepidiformaceae bacterium]